jgi:hypothetical protein
MTRALWLELATLTLLAATAAAAVPLSAGEWAWSWDALNHHIYLGAIAQHPRWHLDVVAASVQSYQYPYLYWPVYWLSTQPVSGATAGAIWGASLAALLLVPTWLASLHLLRADSGPWQARFDRSAACALALSSILVLAALNTTANDPLTAVPLLWAVALMARPAPGSGRAAGAAALWGVATAFKLSNGLFLPLLLLWWWVPPSGRAPWWWLRRGLGIAAGASLGFVLTYAPWGWQLWQHTGNPFYPLFGGIFGR